MDATEELEALMARIAMGDQTAFGDLYAQTAPTFLGIASRLTGNPVDAQAVVEGVFNTIWNEADAWQTSGLSALAWLVSLTREAALARRPPAGTAPPVDTCQLFPGRGVGGIGSGETGRLRDCLETAAPARAELLRRVCLDGQGYADLALATDLDAAVLRQSLRRELVKLRECLVS